MQIIEIEVSSLPGSPLVAVRKMMRFRKEGKQLYQSMKREKYLSECPQFLSVKCFSPVATVTLKLLRPSVG